ncbi:uncharacterized protein LOC121964287 [Plectropomus leopardus]|uniref:uncharacterized protein LOC121964287 n=1 Tax=Plectropomus leopardus TaxID=160734 RepID=UPI001C4C3CCA|nr:uncharacterized protein LOC121964287 [Plectropomus leopardus]
MAAGNVVQSRIWVRRSEGTGDGQETKASGGRKGGSAVARVKVGKGRRNGKRLERRPEPWTKRHGAQDERENLVAARCQQPRPRRVGRRRRESQPRPAAAGRVEARVPQQERSGAIVEYMRPRAPIPRCQKFHQETNSAIAEVEQYRAPAAQCQEPQGDRAAVDGQEEQEVALTSQCQAVQHERAAQIEEGEQSRQHNVENPRSGELAGVGGRHDTSDASGKPDLRGWWDRVCSSYELSRQLEPPVDLCSPPPWSHRTLTKKLSSLLTVSDGSKKVPADQISVSSSGSSGSELEDLSSPNSACSIRLQCFHSSCNNVSEAFSSSSSCSSSSYPCSTADSSPDSPSSSSSSSASDRRTDLCSSATSCGGARPKPSPASIHKRSVSMTSLPVYNRQVADSCIVRVSVDLGHSNGNLYKSILLTSQDKTAQVIQRALEKHHLEHLNWQDFSLTQVISQGRDLLMPDKANVFYAMSTTANFDFVLRQFPKGQKKPLRATMSLGRFTK